jgi:hypothetical protein
LTTRKIVEYFSCQAIGVSSNFALVMRIGSHFNLESAWAASLDLRPCGHGFRVTTAPGRFGIEGVNAATL